MQVTVTLTFASDTEAIAYLQGKPPAAAAKTEKDSPKAETKKPVPADSPSPAPAPAPKTTQAQEKLPEVTYEQVGQAIASLAAKDRAKTIAILGELGVKKGPELKPEQYEDALKKFKAALEVETV